MEYSIVVVKTGWDTTDQGEKSIPMIAPPSLHIHTQSPNHARQNLTGPGSLNIVWHGRARSRTIYSFGTVGLGFAWLGELEEEGALGFKIKMTSCTWCCDKGFLNYLTGHFIGRWWAEKNNLLHHIGPILFRYLERLSFISHSVLVNPEHRVR